MVKNGSLTAPLCFLRLASLSAAAKAAAAAAPAAAAALSVSSPPNESWSFKKVGTVLVERKSASS